MDYKEVRKYVELQRKQLEEFAALPVDLAVDALQDQSHEMRDLFLSGLTIHRMFRWLTILFLRPWQI
ncbi:MAG: hypothetical protein ACLSE8_05255 [Parasutterella sp.]